MADSRMDSVAAVPVTEHSTAGRKGEKTDRGFAWAVCFARYFEHLQNELH